MQGRKCIRIIVEREAGVPKRIRDATRTQCDGCELLVGNGPECDRARGPPVRLARVEIISLRGIEVPCDEVRLGVVRVEFERSAYESESVGVSRPSELEIGEACLLYTSDAADE